MRLFKEMKGYIYSERERERLRETERDRLRERAKERERERERESATDEVRARERQEKGWKRNGCYSERQQKARERGRHKTKPSQWA